MIYLELFWAFFQVGLFSFGGGYAAIPLIQEQVVSKHAWMDMAEYADLITITQTAPGSIAVNSATFVGTRIAGLGGAVISTLGCILPSTLIVLTLAYFYRKYRNLNSVQTILKSLRPAVIGMIASAAFSILLQALWGDNEISSSLNSINWISVAIVLAALAVIRKYKPNPLFIMLGAGLIGAVVYSFI